MPDKIDPTTFDLAHRALEFRSALDRLLKAHGARLTLAWEGKWVKLRVMFPDTTDKMGLTIVQTAKGKRVRYITDEEESHESPAD